MHSTLPIFRYVLRFIRIPFLSTHLNFLFSKKFQLQFLLFQVRSAFWVNLKERKAQTSNRPLKLLISLPSDRRNIFSVSSGRVRQNVPPARNQNELVLSSRCICVRERCRNPRNIYLKRGNVNFPMRVLSKNLIIFGWHAKFFTVS